MHQILKGTSVTITAKPEILRPGQPHAPGQSHAEGIFRDENLDTLSHLLDDFIRIPGTPIRFGLDGIVGFIPGIGDVLGGLASTIIIVAAWMRGVSRVTVARMVLNVAIETVVGSVPVLGNLFDIGWRANRRNYALLTGSIAEPERHRRRSWLFLAGVCVLLALIVLAPMMLFGWVLLHLGHSLAHNIR